MEIKYVAMPITFEQKREYNRQGFRVVDAAFAPEGAEIEPVEPVEPEAQQPKRQRRNRTVADAE